MIEANKRHLKLDHALYCTKNEILNVKLQFLCNLDTEKMIFLLRISLVNLNKFEVLYIKSVTIRSFFCSEISSIFN